MIKLDKNLIFKQIQLYPSVAGSSQKSTAKLFGMESNFFMHFKNPRYPFT